MMSDNRIKLNENGKEAMPRFPVNVVYTKIVTIEYVRDQDGKYFTKMSSGSRLPKYDPVEAIDKIVALEKIAAMSH